MDLWHHIIAFFDSSFFVALVTLAAGLFAFVIYVRTNAARKRDAANIVYSEMKNAQRVFGQISKSLHSGTLPERIFLMKNSSWNTYKYLFINDLDRDEWDAVAEFYTKCWLYDEAVTYNDSAFQKNEEQVRINLQRVLSDFTKDYANDFEAAKGDKAKETAAADTFVGRKTGYAGTYMDKKNLDDQYYAPQKPIDDAKASVSNLTSNPSLVTAEGKLKKIARLK